ncbi:MAG: phosphotransferase [Acidimicrobiales bacterium]
MAQPPWSGRPIWLHGDLHAFNLLADQGRLSAVIDFGDITGGDPATDLAIAFSMFDPTHRRTFRDAAQSDHRPIDDAMWSRAEGWALTVGLAIAASSADHPPMMELGRKMIGLA